MHQVLGTSLPSSFSSNPHFSWSLPHGLPSHLDLHSREGGTMSQESRTLGPDSHFALLCCKTSGQYLPLSGQIISKALSHIGCPGCEFLGTPELSMCFQSCLGHSRCSGKEHRNVMKWFISNVWAPNCMDLVGGLWLSGGAHSPEGAVSRAGLGWGRREVLVLLIFMEIL